MLLAFGFTHCPDVCPTTLAKLAEAMRLLGPLSNDVQVLMVTVDPERDTPAVLARYVPAFHPSFLGLWGDRQAIARTAAEFKVFYQATPPDSAGNYAVDHSSQQYAFDRAGRLRLFIRHEASAESIARDVRKLL